MDINKKIMRYRSKRIYFIHMDYTKKASIDFFKNKFDNFFDIIIDDGGHYKSHILNNFNNFFDCLKKDSFYIIEGFGLKYKHFDDLKNEFTVKKILYFFKNKFFFKSKIFNKRKQKKIIANINGVYFFKGDYIRNNINLSDICFIKKKVSNN